MKEENLINFADLETKYNVNKSYCVVDKEEWERVTRLFYVCEVEPNRIVVERKLYNHVIDELFGVESIARNKHY